MKKIRTCMVLAGVSLALFVLSATGAKAQALYSTNFVGTFALPFEVQWGGMTLPAGEYSLYYGSMNGGTTYMVEVIGKEEANRHALIRPRPANQDSASKSELICIRDGNRSFVRELRMAEIGKSVSFALPRGMQLFANQQRHSGNTQIAQGPMLIQRVRVKPIRK